MNKFQMRAEEINLTSRLHRLEQEKWTTEDIDALTRMNEEILEINKALSALRLELYARDREIYVGSSY